MGTKKKGSPAEPEETREETPAAEEKDFVFRFKLDRDGAGQVVYDDPLTELVRSQLEALLGVVVLTRNGEEIRGVDGFRFMKHLDRQYRIYPEIKE